MSPNERDVACLWDMVQYSKYCIDIMANQSRQDWESDLTVRLAIERSLEIVGEAARRVSTEFQAAHPELPWRPLIGQRNILAHDYGQIDYARLSATITKDLPPLVGQLQNLLAILETGKPV
jgi:uncharacterized protein with HEPN domain